MTVEKNLSALKQSTRNLGYPARYQALMKAASELVEDAAESISHTVPSNRYAEHLLLAERLEEMATSFEHLR